MAKLLVVGHRGAKGLAPENTLEGLKVAFNVGADMIEIDVRVTSDGVPILHHDNDIEKNGSKYKIDQTSWSSLHNLAPTIPTLDEALNIIDKKHSIMVEIKPKVALQPVIEILQKHLKSHISQNQILITSRDYNILKTFKQVMPHLQLVVIERFFGIRATLRARRLGTPYVNMAAYNMWPGFIVSVSKNYRLFVYDLDDPYKAERWFELGIYGVITNFPDRFTPR